MNMGKKVDGVERFAYLSALSLVVRSLTSSPTLATFVIADYGQNPAVPYFLAGGRKGCPALSQGCSNVPRRSFLSMRLKALSIPRVSQRWGV